MDCKVKEEPQDPDSEYILTEDEIKIEEQPLEDTKSDILTNNLHSLGEHRSYPLESVIIEKRLTICSLCKCTFERNNSKFPLRQELDLTKCNKCILHSRLNHVFNSNKLKANNNNNNKIRKKKQVNNLKIKQTAELIPNTQHQSILIKKLMFICQTCRKPFEPLENVKVHSNSDFLKCNKCILHSRLNFVIRSGRKTTK